MVANDSADFKYCRLEDAQGISVSDWLVNLF